VVRPVPDFKPKSTARQCLTDARWNFLWSKRYIRLRNRLPSQSRPAASYNRVCWHAALGPLCADKLVASATRRRTYSRRCAISTAPLPIRPRLSRWRGLRDFIGNMPTFPGIYPDYSAPIVRNAPDGLRASFARAIRRWQRCLKFAGRMVWSILPSALYVACASRSVREFRRPALQQSGSALTHTGAFSKAEDLLREPATSGPAHRARRW
jgi:hypothetical protein